MSSLLSGISERKIVRWSLAYLAAAWVGLEVLAFAGEVFGLPPAVLRGATVLSIFGLPAVLVLAWFHGERGAQRVGALEIALLLLLATGAAGWAIWAARDPGPGTAEAAPLRAPAHSVAVLPFVNMGGDPAEDYFSDGVTEEILNALAQVGGLRVAARTSSFAFRGDGHDVRAIGDSLGVGAVLEGSVRRVGDEIKITAQLIDASTGYHLWSNTFERPSDDLFAVQDEIARAIANALELRLAEDVGPARPPSADPAALDAYLRGRQAWNERTEASLRRAVELFREATTLDPGFALAYSGLADAYGLLEDYGRMPADEAFPLAIQAARQALEIDETLAEAHASLGHVYMHQHQWERADESYRTALALNPSYAVAHHWYSLQLMWTGRLEEALEENRLARELDPLSPKIEAVTGVILFYARRYGDAVEYLERVVERRPGSSTGHQFLAFARSRLGRYEEALSAVRRLEEITGDPWHFSEARVLAEAGRRDEARALLGEALREMPDARRTHHDVPAILAILGEREEALDVLDGSLPSARLYLAIDPAFDDLRDDPRFRARLEDMSLAAAPRPGSR